MSSVQPWAYPDTKYDLSNAEETRTSFKHDGDGIVYSAAFRRLSNKSQVVVKPERQGQFRSRLTHTLEVQRTAQSIGIPLGLNISLIDAISLGHDIGHAPFGHAGERAFQRIMRNELLPLCDSDRLQSGFDERFKVKEIAFVRNNDHINNHWLFHHAINSVRTVERKLTDISAVTCDGILKHGWSPWQPVGTAKFGTPSSYEAQAVAIADQVACLMHDIEDILSFGLSEYDLNRMRDELTRYIGVETELGYPAAQDIIDGWFLPRDCNVNDAWMRKLRLQKVINSVIVASTERLQSAEVTDHTHATDASTCLVLGPEIAMFLHGCERFLREEIIQKSAWFRHRDAVAAAIVNTVFTFYRYRRDEGDPSIREALESFKASKNEPYERDNYYLLFRNSSKVGKEESVVETLEVADYVSGMTDDYIMEVHALAIETFR